MRKPKPTREEIDQAVANWKAKGNEITKLDPTDTNVPDGIVGNYADAFLMKGDTRGLYREGL